MNFHERESIVKQYSDRDDTPERTHEVLADCPTCAKEKPKSEIDRNGECCDCVDAFEKDYKEGRPYGTNKNNLDGGNNNATS